MQTYEIILIALSVGQLLAMVVGGYIFLSKPSARANDKIDILKATCGLKHSRIDEIFKETSENISEIKKTFELFKVNEFKHIEDYTKSINERMASIEGQNKAILEIMTQVLNKN